MDRLKARLSEMNYDVMSIITKTSLKKVIGGFEEVPPNEEGILEMGNANSANVTICKHQAILADLV